MYEMSCQSRFDARYWMLGAGALGQPRGMELRSPALQVDSLPGEPQGKPKNTGVGSLSLLQGIFLTQELNQVFLHCRQILYQLSYQGKLRVIIKFNNPRLLDRRVVHKSQL